MGRMFETQELIERPLSSEELATRYRVLCEDPCLVNVPGKIELDVWGRILMTPASLYHGLGAEEVWIVYPQSKRCEFFDKQGSIARSGYAVDLSDVFN